MPTNVFDPDLDLYVLSIVAVLTAAVIAIVLIVKVTRRSLISQVENTLSRLTADVPVPVPTGDTAFVTHGLGETVWRAGGLIYKMGKSHVVPTEAEAGREADESFDRLVVALAGKGIDPRDVAESEEPKVETHAEGYVYHSSVVVLMRDGGRRAEVDAVARQEGYTSRISADGVEEIEMISLSDAHRTAGERAIEDAIENASTVAAKLELGLASLGMVTVDLSTSELPSVNGLVTKTAKVTWRRAVRTGDDRLAPQDHVLS